MIPKIIKMYRLLIQVHLNSKIIHMVKAVVIRAMVHKTINIINQSNKPNHQPNTISNMKAISLNLVIYVMRAVTGP